MSGLLMLLPVQMMILVAKLPPSMEVVAQLINQTKPADIKALKPDEIIAAATLAFEQHSQRSTAGNGHQANKLSAVKRKQADPKFAQQQQQAPRPQQQQGDGGQSRNAPTNHSDKHFVRFKVKAQLDKSQKDSVLLCKRRLYSTNLDKSQKDYSRSVSY